MINHKPVITVHRKNNSVMKSLGGIFCGARNFGLTLILITSLSACGETSAQRVEICTSSTDNSSLSQSVIYGEATWVSPAEATELLSASQSTAIAAEVAIFRGSHLNGSNGTPLTQSSLLCDGEPLADEVALAACSGVLIAPDLLLTAKHCTESVPCQEMFITTDFDEAIHPGDAWSFEGRRCVRVLAGDRDLDTAVIELYPAFDETISIASLRIEPLLETLPVILASHPLGTSTKVDLDAQARPSARSKGHMWFRGDAFKGSSGAGVFDAHGRLVGLVTAGLSDFNYDHDAQCMRIVRSESEGFERLASPFSVLHEACEVIPEHFLCSKPLIFEAVDPHQPEQPGCR